MSIICTRRRLALLGLVAVLLGTLPACGSRPAPVEKETAAPAPLVVDSKPVSGADKPAEVDKRPAPTPAPTPEPKQPPTVATLETQLPPGARLAIDGKDVGAQERILLPCAAAERFERHDACVTLKEGGEVRRTLLVRAGDTVRLAVPGGGTARSEVVLQTGHTDAITAVACSPDGKLVLTGSRDQTALLWDAVAAHQLRSLRGHTAAVEAAVFRPDGSQVLTASADQTAILWDVATGAKVLTLRGHKGAVRAAAFRFDGRRLVTGSDDRTAIVWDAATGKPVRVLAEDNQQQGVGAVAFSADGKYVLTAPHQTTAILWDATTGQKVRSYIGHTGIVTAVAFHPDGASVLTASEDKTAILWSATSGEQVRTYTGHTGAVTAAAFNRDGGRLLTGSADKSVILWETASGKKLRTGEGRDAFITTKGGEYQGSHSARVNSVAFTPDGKQAVSGSADRTALFWNLASGSLIRTLSGRTERLTAVAFHPDGKQILTGSSDQTALVWDTTTGQKLRALQGHVSGVTAVAFGPGGTQALSAALDRTAVLWDTATGQNVRAFLGHTGPVAAVAFRPDGKQVLTGSSDHTAILWDAATGHRLHAFQKHTGPVTCVAFHPDGKQALTGSTDQTAILWNVATAQAVLTLDGHSAPVRSAVFSPDGKQVATAADDQTAILWDAGTGKQIHTFRAHTGSVTAVAFMPNGPYLVTGSTDQTAILWDTRSGAALRTFPEPATRSSAAAVTALAFSPDGQRILTAGLDGTARFWDVGTGDELACLVSFDRGRDWAIISPEGLFDGTKGSRDRILFRGADLDLVPLDRFLQDSYAPGFLAEVWRGERPQPGKGLQGSAAPLLKMLVNPAREVDRVHVDVAVTDQGGGIRAPTLTHNGAPVAGRQKLRAGDRTDHYRFTVTLTRGDNQLEVRAASADGKAPSEAARLCLPFDGKRPTPELYVLAVGIDSYAEKGFDLEFCVADARAMADAFRRRSEKLYGRVHVVSLLDEEATRTRILEAATSVARKAQPQDTLVVFVAGHGRTVGQRYYLIPHEFRLTSREQPDDDIRAQGLAIDVLGEALAEVKALKRVLIFDTCHSGAVAALSGKRQNPFAFRSALERVSRAQGVYSLSATSADELAAETKDLGHSILTYALLAGLHATNVGPLAGKGIRGKDGAPIDVLAWFQFAQENVPVLYTRYVGRPQHLEMSGDDQPTFPLFDRAEPADVPAGKEPKLPRAFALLIGINSQADPQIMPRPHAEADVQALYDLFTDPAYLGVAPSRVRLLLGTTKDARRQGRAARRADILDALRWLRTSAGPDDMVLIAWVGQGAPLGQRGERLCYFASDSTFKSREETAVAAEDVAQELDRLKSQRVAIFLDVNFTGFHPGAADVPEPVYGARPFQEFLGADGALTARYAPGRVLLMPNEGNKASPDGNGHGLLAHLLVIGLRGAADKEGYEPDGQVTVDELKAYLDEQVPALARWQGTTDKERDQKPVCLRGRGSDFVLTRNPALTAKVQGRLARLAGLPRELAEEGRPLLERMPKLEAHQALRKEYQRLVDEAITGEQLRAERARIRLGTQLSRKAAVTFADKVMTAAAETEQRHVKGVTRGELVTLAIRGLYEQLDESLPDGIADRLKRARSLTASELKNLLADVRQALGKREDLDGHKDIDIAVARMLEPLDARTSYVTPEMVREFQAGSGAATASIGVNLRKEVRTDLVQVVTPIKNGPAYRAGIRAGDVITQLIRDVDSEGRLLRPAEVVGMQGLALKDVVKKLQGKARTKIKVVLRREGIDQPLTFEMVRGQVRTESVLGFRRKADDNWEFMIDPVRKIGYVRLTQLGRDTTDDLRAVLEGLRRRGMKGLVLDLRFNPGGLLLTAIDVADLFIPDGVIVSVRPFKDLPLSFVSQKKGSFCDFPLVCLINPTTAAGSEIVAACLQDHHRAVVIGERSYGLGSIQTITAFDGGYLKLTTAVFERASGRNLDKATTSGSPEDAWGVRPDWGFALELSAKERADLEDYLRETEAIRRRDRPHEAPQLRDRQLEMALEHLGKTLQRP